MVIMIEVFKMVHKYYDINEAVKLNFNMFSTSTGNKYKLQKIQAIITYESLPFPRG